MSKIIIETRPSTGVDFRAKSATYTSNSKITAFINACVADGIITSVTEQTSPDGLVMTKTYETDVPQVLDALRVFYFPSRANDILSYIQEGHSFQEVPAFDSSLTTEQQQQYNNFIIKNVI
jgi:hypothetical protein